ncbi:hypothetical protein CTAYLR_001147 [Chrysophaeum taylorii]|uniref:Myosin motor domain-containing protein n=1 Tax=Chrysophaeum taylorii TaxID=2483200 RepID=A0AAD7UP12_9STRA|nr:hypothetical protein CTAYLR_001147 [Chrysophaeum taylorii]
MEAGACVWVRDEAEGWVAGVLVEKRGDSLVIDVEGCVRHVKTRSESEEVETEDVKPREEDSETPTDLISLPVLHEPAILHALERRYEGGAIYTFNGAILIAVNPFQKLDLYTDEILESYYNNGLMKSQGIESGAMEPHVYTIADAAYRDMATCIARRVDASQSILISGESGAGKTESTKICMRYLTVAGASNETSVMDRVLQSNPILEAFGNARTVRNDNSSRFGKYIDLKFDPRGTMRGAAIETYLLEKIRLPRHAPGERNFHIFYQLHAARTRSTDDAVGLATADLMKEPWALDEACGAYYQYTKQGGVLELEHLDDGVEFVKLAKALKTLGFVGEDAAKALALVASLLHLGDVQFDFDAGSDGGGSVVAPSGELGHAARLSGLPEDALLQALTRRTVKTRAEEYVVRLVPDDAASARDAVAKALYGRLFEWLVEKINQGVNNTTETTIASIGVLDIFGFECFASNSFEQLCINYTNETLQQQFNRYVFKLEQEEYAREAITWSFIEFPDNQDCLDLIEGTRRQMPPDGGLLAMLDDECRLPRGSDANYAARVSKSLGAASKRLSVSKKQVVEGIFAVSHYAGLVPYAVKGFLEKNKDELPRAAGQLFDEARSSEPLIGAICDSHFRAAERAAQAAASASARRGSSGRSASVKPTAGTITVGTQFKTQLASLMRAVGQTKPHYIRCLKPNDKNVPNQFWRARVTEQLRYGGVLEAVRVARSGFPVRMSHVEFSSYYAVLGPSTRFEDDKKKHCEAIIAAASAACGFAADQAQLGKTKVFLRKSAHDAMEAARTHARRAAATVLTSVARTFMCSSSLSRRLAAARRLARIARGAIARARARTARRRRASIAIQKTARSARSLSTYVAARRGACLLAALARGARGRVQAETLRRLRAVSLIARTVGRGAPKRLAFLRSRSALVSFQCRARARMAKKALRALRLAERDVGRLRQEQAKMKEEILRLRQQAAAAALEREAAAAKASSEEVARLKDAMEREKHQWLDEQKLARQKASDELLLVKESAEAQVARLRAALDAESAERLRAEEALRVAHSERDAARAESRDLKSRLAAAAAAAVKENPQPLLESVVPSQQQQQQQQQKTPEKQPPPQQAAAAAQQLQERDNAISRLRAELEAERAARAEAERAARAEAERAAASVAAAAQTTRRSDAPRTSYERPSSISVDEDADGFNDAGDDEDEVFREKARSGVLVAVWEEDVVAGEPVSLVVVEDKDDKFALSFQSRSRNLFRRKKPPHAVTSDDVYAVRPGHSSLCGLSGDDDDSAFITLVAEQPDDAAAAGGIRREIVIQFASVEARKEALAGLRHLLAKRGLAAPVPAVAKATPTPKGKTLPPSPAPPKHQPTPPPKQLPPAPTPTDDAVAELEKQLLLERANNQKMMLQMLEMQNDVNRSSAKIVELKQEAAGLRAQLVSRDRMHADDARMRLQLGKRLQQLVFDNAALRRECDDLNAQLAKKY